MNERAIADALAEGLGPEAQELIVVRPDGTREAMAVSNPEVLAELAALESGRREPEMRKAS